MRIALASSCWLSPFAAGAQAPQPSASASHRDERAPAITGEGVMWGAPWPWTRSTPRAAHGPQGGVYSATTRARPATVSAVRKWWTWTRVDVIVVQRTAARAWLDAIVKELQVPQVTESCRQPEDPRR